MKCGGHIWNKAQPNRWGYGFQQFGLGSYLVLETDGAGNPVRKYVRGINLISMTDADGISFYLYNAHGDVVQLVAEDGSTLQQVSHDDINWNSVGISAVIGAPFGILGFGVGSLAKEAAKGAAIGAESFVNAWFNFTIVGPSQSTTEYITNGTNPTGNKTDSSSSNAQNMIKIAGSIASVMASIIAQTLQTSKQETKQPYTWKYEKTA